MTIIVLLILAGISINVLAGQNGLLNRTAESKESTESSQVEENLKLAIMEAMTKGLGKLTDENLKESLNNIGISNDDISGNVFGGWSVDSKKNSTTYKIKTDGTTNAVPYIQDETYPYLPTEKFDIIEGTDLKSGLVAKDLERKRVCVGRSS